MSVAFSIHKRRTTCPLMSRPKMLPACLGHLGLGQSELDSARFAPAARLNLRLYHHGVSEPFGGRFRPRQLCRLPRLARRVSRIAAKYCFPWYSIRSTGHLPVGRFGPRPRQLQLTRC